MSKINEELIEQVKVIADKYAIATLKFEDRVDEEMMATFQAEAHIDRRGIIALAEFFVAAVRRGALDEALGVVGRAHIWGFVEDENGDTAILPDGPLYVNKGDILIALRPEEEEK